jgi:hypothetical protein
MTTAAKDCCKAEGPFLGANLNGYVTIAGTPNAQSTDAAHERKST